MTHTKGPWTIGNNEGFWGVDCCIMADDPDVGPVCVAEVVHATAIEEADNMRLIAAAPDLLSACEQVAAWVLIDPNFQDWPAAASYLKQLEQVVAKAKGEAA